MGKKENNMELYDYLIFDTVNTGYFVLNHPEKSKENRSELITIQGKRIYRHFLKNLIEMIGSLKSKYLQDNGEIVFLIDNYESREELKALLKPLASSQNRKKVNESYKSGRVNQKFEFYNTLDILRYYYLVQTKQYHTARIPNLEADDLVPPCLKRVSPNNDKKVLLVTNDSDWCRYLSENVHYLPNLYEAPVGIGEFTRIHGYPPTEGKIILDKILNGDSADNIEAVFMDIPPFLRERIVEVFDDVVDFMFNIGGNPEFKQYATLVKDRENDIRIAYQMLAAIPVGMQHFNAIWTTGRDSKVMVETIHRKLYDEEGKATFTFGVKSPRVDP